MAIKIECTSCGFQNDLGRVFCAQCGKKLDLRDTSMQALDDRREFDFGKWIRRGLSTIVLLLIVGVVGLAAWPTRPVPVYTEAVGARQIPVKLSAVLRALSYNQNITLDFQEGELNGFLAERAKVRHLKALTIDLKPGSFDLYATFNWTPVTNLAFLAKVTIPVSMSLSGGFMGGVFIPGKAQVGHLPLIGRTRDLATVFFASLCPDMIAQQRLIDSLRTVAIEETRADLTLVPVGK